MTPGSATARRSGLLPLEDAQRFVLESVRPLASGKVDLDEALGLRSAASIVATSDVPPFANSAMDGYALRSADTARVPARLEVVGSVLAGDVPEVPVGPGEAMRIMTGAPVPDGADAVVPVELTETEPDAVHVAVSVTVASGSHVRRPGENIRRGQEVISPGTLLTPAHIGVLASLGLSKVEVHVAPRVGVLSTGDELAQAGGDLGAGKIRDSNRPALLALLRHSGYGAVDLGCVADDEVSIRSALSEGASRCDALLTSGGVSVGDVDLVKVVLEELGGGSMRWMQVAIKPAKPFAFGLLDGGRVPVFGLAGNPVSALVGFELFARPALGLMAGDPQPLRRRLHAAAATGLSRERDGKTHLVRVTTRVDDAGVLRASPSGTQASHMLLGLAGANALAVLPDGEGVEEGAVVEVIPLAGSLDSLLEAEGTVG
jgi:molybdopterin molybdotransferase